ncbi:MAG: hypothetical protein ABIF77_21520 [bacterium]
MKRWKCLATAAILLGFGLMLLLGGCSENRGNESQRLVCEVALVNGGEPLVSGYLNAGPDRLADTTDDFAPIDFVEVLFHARPYSRMITIPEDAPYSYFHVTGYDLIWHPVTVGGEELPNYNMIGAATDCLVPVNREASVSVLVADRYMKEATFFSDLYNGGKLPFMARCELRFRGHETGSDTEVEVVGSFMVSFLGMVID